MPLTKRRNACVCVCVCVLDSIDLEGHWYTDSTIRVVYTDTTKHRERETESETGNGADELKTEVGGGDEGTARDG